VIIVLEEEAVAVEVALGLRDMAEALMDLVFPL